jgi:CRP/FNR family transcriptional regulator, cyclic AMP receptor protein
MGSEALDPVRVLLSTYVFQDLSPAEVEPLAKTARARDYRRGEYLFHAGDPADYLHVVASGQIKNSMTTKDGDEFIYDVLTQGGVFGEPGIFSREHNRVLDAVAMEPSTVLDIPREQLVDFMQRHRPVLMRILAGLASQAREPIETVTDIGYTQIRERVVHKLLQLAATHGQELADDSVEITLTVSQTTLAGLVGATRENVNRALGTLTADGDVRLVQGRIVIPNIAALRAKVDRGLQTVHRRNLTREEAARRRDATPK